MRTRCLLLALLALAVVSACGKKEKDGDDCPSVDETEPNDSVAQANFLGTDEEVFDCHGAQAPTNDPFGSYYVDATCGATDAEDWFEVDMLDIGGGHYLEPTVTASDLTGMRLAVLGSDFSGQVDEVDDVSADGLHLDNLNLEGPVTVTVLCSSSAVTAVRSYELTIDFFCDCD